MRRALPLHHPDPVLSRGGRAGRLAGVGARRLARRGGRLRRRGAGGAAARPFLFINQERLLTGSKAGQALLADEERQRDTLRSEARALDASFEAEERQLTDQRPTLPPEEFRKLADAFDARVVQARQRAGRAGQRAGAGV